MRSAIIALAVSEARRAELLEAAATRRRGARPRRRAAAVASIGDLVRGVMRRLRPIRRSAADVGPSLP